LQLSQIESGERPTLSDWKFLRRAAEVYAISTDWFLGLSPDAEPDSRIIREHALLCGYEGIVRAFAGQTADALVQTARQTTVVEVRNCASTSPPGRFPEATRRRTRSYIDSGRGEDRPTRANVLAVDSEPPQ
jgi:transcriptional regulator with XRE-family HTH domain